MTRLSYDLLAEVQEWDPTDSHDERYLIVASGESTLQERRRGDRGTARHRMDVRRGLPVDRRQGPTWVWS